MSGHNTRFNLATADNTQEPTSTVDGSQVIESPEQWGAGALITTAGDGEIRYIPEPSQPGQRIELAISQSNVLHKVYIKTRASLPWKLSESTDLVMTSDGAVIIESMWTHLGLRWFATFSDGTVTYSS